MTLDECTRLLRRLQALERLTRAIAFNALAGDWAYGVEAMGWEILAVRYQLSLAHPSIVATAEDLLAAEIRNVPRDDLSRPTPLLAVDGPRSSRIH